MKRCPECRRDYYDDTLSFCLADGTELVYGLSEQEPATAMLTAVPAVVADSTRDTDNGLANTAILQPAHTEQNEGRSCGVRGGKGPFCGTGRSAGSGEEASGNISRARLDSLFTRALRPTAGLFPNLVRRASILCELGRLDKAVLLLEQSAANGEWWLFIVKVDPQFEVLRDEPRFQAIVKQFEVPQK